MEIPVLPVQPVDVMVDPVMSNLEL